MGQDLLDGCSEKPRILGLNQENLRRRDPKSRELLGPLFGQVAVATARNVLYNGVGKLQNVDRMLADKVAQLRERKEQLLQTAQNEDEAGGGVGDCSLEPEGKHQRFDHHVKVNVGYILQNEQLEHLKDD